MEKGKEVKEEVKKTAKELKKEAIELRAVEILQIEKDLMEWCKDHDIGIGSRTITEEGGRSYNQIFVIDKL